MSLIENFTIDTQVSIQILLVCNMARVLLLATAASALVAPVAVPKSSAVRAIGAEDMEGAQKPFGFWDPMGLAKDQSPRGLAWFRAAEVKHGRVAMLACTGFIVQGAGVHFNGPIAISSLYPSLSSADVSFADVAAAGNPVAQWAAVPDLGKWQLLFTVGFLETYAEFQKPHYLKGGPIGRVPVLWDPVGQLLRGSPITDTLPEDVREAKRNSELANGRLAMIGAMGFSAAATIDGSVPFFNAGMAHV